MLAYNEWTKVFPQTNGSFFGCMAADDTNPSREDINGIRMKYHCEDFEVLLQDRGSVEDKITLFRTCKGFGTLEDFYTWLQDNPLLLPTSLRDLERGINHMLDMSILARHGEEISFQVLPSTRAVILGRRIIASDVFGVLQSRSQTVPTTLFLFQFLGNTSKTDCEIRQWKRQKLRKYQTYSGCNNCISYALDFAAFLGTPVG